MKWKRPVTRKESRRSRKKKRRKARYLQGGGRSYGVDSDKSCYLPRSRPMDVATVRRRKQHLKSRNLPEMATGYSISSSSTHSCNTLRTMARRGCFYAMMMIIKYMVSCNFIYALS